MQITESPREKAARLYGEIMREGAGKVLPSEAAAAVGAATGMPAVEVLLAFTGKPADFGCR